MTVVSVLHVAQPTDGGVAGYVVAACRDQMLRGWNVTVACPPEGRLAEELSRLGVPSLAWPAGRSPGAASLDEARRLGRLVEARRPDVVHLHASKAGLAGRLALRGSVPTLFQPHAWSWLAVGGAVRRASIAWERAAARWTTLFVCVGAAEAEQGRAMRVRGRYTVVRNGVDLDRFRPAGDDVRAAARRQLDIRQTAPVAVCVGRVTRQKGQDVLVPAWRLVRDRCPDAELVLVGDGDLLPALRDTAPPGVRFAGAATDVRPWLAAADLVVLPSRWEGLPLTALEALATGRPVVASAVPGLVEVVAPGTGALVPPQDPAALADALTQRLRDRTGTATEGAAAARHAHRFDLTHTFDRLAAVTGSLVPQGVLA
ncbi:MAG: glycosyltransferase family 4 protein [Actinobacteria bacterium]|nr:MAG: glycosyltransferase family 4 protein [Actinomycetota bacterium]